MGYLARLLGPCWELPGPPSLGTLCDRRSGLTCISTNACCISDNKNNAKMKETEVQHFSALSHLTICNPIWQLVSLKRALPESSFVLHCLVKIQPLPLGCRWRYPALSSATFHRVSRNKWLRGVIYIGLSNELGSFLIDGRAAKEPTSIKIMKLYCEGQTEAEKDSRAASP